MVRRSWAMTMRRAGTCWRTSDWLLRPRIPSPATHDKPDVPPNDRYLRGAASRIEIQSARTQQLQPKPFEQWKVDRPAVPLRSRFCPIEPCGIRSPLVEGLSSYLVRLSEAHAVSVSDFILEELSAMALPDLSRVARCRAPSQIGYLINGFGEYARSGLRGIEALTLRNDLHHLTLLPFKSFLPS